MIQHQQPAQAEPSSQSTSLLSNKRARRLIAQIIAYALLVGGGVVMFAPFLWMVSSSLKDPGTYFFH